MTKAEKKPQRLYVVSMELPRAAGCLCEQRSVLVSAETIYHARAYANNHMSVTAASTEDIVRLAKLGIVQVDAEGEPLDFPPSATQHLDEGVAAGDLAAIGEKVQAAQGAPNIPLGFAGADQGVFYNDGDPVAQRLSLQRRFLPLTSDPTATPDPNDFSDDPFDADGKGA